MYFNARSLIPKIDELKLICASSRPDVVCVVETWLSDEITDSEIAIPDFCITRLDRNRQGVGIAFYVRSNLNSQVLLQHPQDLEFVLFSVVNFNFSYKYMLVFFIVLPVHLQLRWIFCIHAYKM